MWRLAMISLAAHLRSTLVVLLTLAPDTARSATLSVRIPNETANALAQVTAGHYRLDYWPSQGVPSPNMTLSPEKLLQPIELTELLPGTSYHFRLLFWNGTLDAWPAFNFTRPTETEETFSKEGTSEETYDSIDPSSSLTLDPGTNKLRVLHNASYTVHEGDQFSLNCEKESRFSYDEVHFAWRWKPDSFVQTLDRNDFSNLSRVKVPIDVSYDGTSDTVKLVSRLRWSNIARNASGTYFCYDDSDDGNFIHSLFRVNVTAGPLSNEISQIGTKTKVAISVALLLLLALPLTIVLYVVYRRRKEAALLRSTSHQNLAQSLEGNLNHINPDAPLDDQVELLPYARTWEFPEGSLFLEKQIGCGHFGRVIKARAIGIIPSVPSETIEVAVKMVKSRGDMIELKSLIGELKILVHLGSHLNVVNLLGAVTKNIKKGTLMVIVEYCRNGNLKDYLIDNRSSFVNELGNDGNVKASVSEIRRDMTLGIGEASNNERNTDVNGLSDVQSVQQQNDDDRAEIRRLRNKPGARDMRSCVITTSDLIEWSFEIASGMNFLAEKKVIHGDLAARNVLLADDNVVKIADFGLARKFYQDSNYVKKGKEPMPIKWLAIESIQDRRFSSNSDVWSFGVTLWELFSLGHEPYIEIEHSQLLRCLLAGYRLAKPKLAPNIICDLMSSCWEENPDKRPTFDCLKQDLGRLLDPVLLAMYQTPYDQFGYITIPYNRTSRTAPSDDQRVEQISHGYLELRSSIGIQPTTRNSDCIATSLLSTSSSFDYGIHDRNARPSDFVKVDYSNPLLATNSNSVEMKFLAKTHTDGAEESDDASIPNRYVQFGISTNEKAKCNV